MVSKVIEKVEANGNCKTDLKGAECQKDTAFELADMSMFYAEADPGFKNWVKAHETVWNQVSGVINGALQGEYAGPVKVMYDSNDKELGTPEFKAYATAEFNDIIDATMGVFCPTSDEAVKKSMEKDDPLVEAAAATAKAQAALKQDAFKEEVLDEAAAKAAAAASDAGPPQQRRLVASEDIQI